MSARTRGEVEEERQVLRKILTNARKCVRSLEDGRLADAEGRLSVIENTLEDKTENRPCREMYADVLKASGYLVEEDIDMTVDCILDIEATATEQFAEVVYE